jgi:hypothetical protein
MKFKFDFYMFCLLLFVSYLIVKLTIEMIDYLIQIFK